ncbi:MAG TPA: phosphate ABC transporter substrate-binding protein PstS [Gaiellaceae bacterium]|nr:phosphate ABC transporter substrate-binding protein PstS [Gaiellaceae bacterium]
MTTTRRRLIGVLLLAAMTALAAGCGGSGGSGSGGSGSGRSTVLVGAGSTLVAPLVAQWSGDYAKKTGATITYGAIGSGGGIAQITARTVDFGASDAPLSRDQAQACKRCLQVPWALAATLVSYNVKGAPAKLKLDGPTLAGIYLGKITSWNDPAIAKLNPGASLPATKITPVFRSDGSGDTYAFSDFLSKVSPEWKSKEGVSAQVGFPTGVGGKGNDGVAAVVGRTDGALGYLAISYVFANKLDYALIENAAGKFPVPRAESISAAAAAATTIPADNAISLTNPPASAPAAYPVSTFTYALVPQSSAKAKAKALRDFFTYAIGPGQRFAPRLQFARLPARVLEADRQTIAKIGSS